MTVIELVLQLHLHATVVKATKQQNISCCILAIMLKQDARWRITIT